MQFILNKTHEMNHIAFTLATKLTKAKRQIRMNLYELQIQYNTSNFDSASLIQQLDSNPESDT
jgi:hypothetical protein